MSSEKVNLAFARRFASASLAGAFTKTAVNPLERLKIVIQINPQPIRFAVKNILIKESPLAFWKGNLSNVIRAVPAKGLLLVSNDVCKQQLGMNPLYSGAVAGVISTFCTYPLDLIRTRVAGVVCSRYQGIFPAIRLTLVEEGITGLWRGCTPTLLGSLPYTAIQFAAYDYFCKQAGKSEAFKNNRVAIAVIAGGLAGFVSQTITHPNDTMRRLMQMEVEKASYFQILSKTLKASGVRALYAGVAANLLRIIPNTAFQFGFYEFFKKALDV
eukprot:TRINITY_DN779778_c0_g1_i1.p1 TRINITY_DN779778_c0_g1~~TRINITY_DN779778_c0_g1_i1.p1  ORF type:complete len:271 (+),score=48.57 TRINITY_DN779778_c0_g1_i1:144-956(+)